MEHSNNTMYITFNNVYHNMKSSLRLCNLVFIASQMAAAAKSGVVRPVAQIKIATKQREGGGFIVRRPLGGGVGYIDPFVMLDHMGPVTYKPGEAVGAPDHPHRGQTTVTYILQGEMEHKDSAGFCGNLSAGWVQWMDAASGVVHAEMPAASIREKGGVVEGFQIWLNLPAKNKKDPPRYQDVPAERIPAIPAAGGSDPLSTVKVIAGSCGGVKGPVETTTPISYWDVALHGEDSFAESVAADHNVIAYVYRGKGRFGGGDREIAEGTMVVFGEGAEITAKSVGPELKFLVLSGKPIGEKIVSYGPFVMNNEEEIYQAFEDYQAGKLGHIEGAEERHAATEAARSAQKKSGSWSKEL